MDTKWVRVHMICDVCSAEKPNVVAFGAACFRVGCTGTYVMAIDATDVLETLAANMETTDDLGGGNDEGYHGHDLRQKR